MKKSKLLIIDDDPYICDLIRLYSDREGYSFVSAEDGEQGISLIFEELPDIILLDIMLPTMEGWEICKEIRKSLDIPIIILTGKGESYDKLKGFSLGADDYVVKPFDPHELMARIKAVLRRGYALYEHRQVISMDNLQLDMTQYTVTMGDKSLVMPPKEIELLYFLTSHKNQVFTRQQLLDQIWGYDFQGDPRTVDVHIKRIREKIGGNSAEWKILTIRGIGYKFEAVS